MNHCQLCGEEIPDGFEYCNNCNWWLREEYAQMEREEQRRAEYEEEMRRDAFEDY